MAWCCEQGRADLEARAADKRCIGWRVVQHLFKELGIRTVPTCQGTVEIEAVLQ